MEMYPHDLEAPTLARRDPAWTNEQDKRLAKAMGVPVPTAPRALDVQEGGDHYKTMKIQPVEYIHANGLPFIEGCVVKYVSRWKSKGGVKDLEKARHFIDLLIELEQRNTNPTKEKP